MDEAAASASARAGPAAAQGHAACSGAAMHRVERRKTITAIHLDRRKSYMDVMERVLGTSQLPDSLPRKSAGTFSRWISQALGRPSIGDDPPRDH
jgi:hypothetical protein